MPRITLLVVLQRGGDELASMRPGRNAPDNRDRPLDAPPGDGALQ